MRSRSRSKRRAPSTTQPVRTYWRGAATSSSSWSLGTWLQAAFLPEGYPASTSADYAAYQAYDTLQALCSTLVGHLATAGLLRASGVGDAEASALGATMVWMLSDGVGHVTRVWFASHNSASLDALCKQYRLLADAANDAALLSSLLAGSVLRGHAAALLCVGAVLRAVVSVAGAATRAAVVVHQARAGNVSDVAAKDGSQETASNLAGLLLGLLLVPLVGGSTQGTYGVYALLTVVHLWANWAAVSCLRFAQVNPLRLDLLLHSYTRSEGTRVGDVDSINAAEPILPLALWRHHSAFRPLRLGIRFPLHARVQPFPRFVLVGDDAVVLHVDATHGDVLEAYAMRRGVQGKDFERFCELARAAGWSFERPSLNVDEWRATW